MYAIAIAAPAACLISFYFSKMPEIRANFRDPYTLPEGFDPKTGEFASGAAAAKTDRPAALPTPIFINEHPGSFGPREKNRRAVD